MKKWVRWQDWTALGVGLYAAIAPFWMMTDTSATRTMVILGVVTVIASLWSLAQPENQFSEYVHAFLGVLFFISPWVMGFTTMTMMAYTAWGVGLIIFIIGMSATPMVQQRLHHAPSH